MINIQIEEENAIDLLVDRVKFWTDDEKVIDLYEKMYNDYCYSGVFDGSDLDVVVIVDNDYFNYCTVIYTDDEDFEKILKVYNKQGLGDCSCEDCNASYIEAVDNEQEPTMFLIRW